MMNNAQPPEISFKHDENERIMNITQRVKVFFSRSDNAKISAQFKEIPFSFYIFEKNICFRAAQTY